MTSKLSVRMVTERNGACVLTLTMGEVLGGSPDIEPSLGAAMDSLEDPLASPHPPTNDRQVAEVVAVMHVGRWLLRNSRWAEHELALGSAITARLEWLWWQTSHITTGGTETTITATTITTTYHRRLPPLSLCALPKPSYFSCHSICNSDSNKLLLRLHQCTEKRAATRTSAISMEVGVGL